MLYFEQKSGQFFQVIGGGKYFPLNIEGSPVEPATGDIVTVGTVYGCNKLAAAAEKTIGRKLDKVGDVTYRVG